VLDSNNVYVDITFDWGVYDTGAGSGSVKPSDFTVIFNQNSGNTTAVSISMMTKTDDSALAGGELVVRAHLTIDGTPIGVETVEIRPAANAVFSLPGVAALNTETTGVLTLNSQMVPVDYGKVIIRQNVINPSKGEYTAINFRLNKSTKVNVTVYDLAGNPVKELYDRRAPAGLTEVRWYGKNKRGRKVVPGVYYVVTTIDKKRDMKKVLIVK
jgi:hypothetical protein